MATDMIVRNVGSCRLELRNEAAFAHTDTALSIQYSRRYRFRNEYRPSSCHGVICADEAGGHVSVLLCAAGGVTGVHERSLCVLENHCFVAVGPYIVGLTLPELEILWSTEVDSATCFGIHPTVDGGALISHGEIEVSRVDLSGKILWKASGADIFTEGLWVTRTEVHVEDFNHDRYVFDVQTGRRRVDVSQTT
jgi:hypothetical protein